MSSPGRGAARGASALMSSAHYIRCHGEERGELAACGLVGPGGPTCAASAPRPLAGRVGRKTDKLTCTQFPLPRSPRHQKKEKVLSLLGRLVLVLVSHVSGSRHLYFETFVGY